MIAHTSGFKTAITSLGRDINVLIDYYTVVYNLITEDDKLIITQDNLELLTEEMEAPTPVSQLTNDDIISLNRNNLGELFRSYMKSFDLETTHKFNVGDKMIIKVGTTVNGEIEYLNYGMYYVYQRQYNEDTQTYTYTLCDRMLFTMIKYDNDTIFGGSDNMSCTQLITSILNYCGFTGAIDIDNRNFANPNVNIYKDTFDGVDMTCRDVLDMILQVNGCSLVIGFNQGTNADYIMSKNISQSSVDTINDDILKDSNITLGKKYGKLNSLLFSRSEGIDNIERKDDTSIAEYGKTQYVIKDNLILDQENRADFIDNLFTVMDGLEYYICDIETIGLGYIEYLDRFTISANGNLYNTICLKNTCNINSGMSENFTTKEIQETAQTFENIGTDDKVASITMDKLKGQIVLKTDSDGKLAQVRLDSAGDDGSLIEIKGDQIKLEGTTTINERFKIDNDGYMYAKAGGEIAGWNITNSALRKDVRIGDYDYRVYVQSPLANYTEDSWIFSTQKKHKNDSGYSGTSVIKMGGDASFKKLNCTLNSSGTSYIDEYGMYIGTTSNGHGVRFSNGVVLDHRGLKFANNYFAPYTQNVNGFYGAPSAGYMLIFVDGYNDPYGINIWSSDKRIKHNIKKTKVKALDLIKKIPHKEFIYNDSKDETVTKIGYIADDLKEIDEQMIYEVGDKKLKQPNVSYIVPLLSKAIQEQQEQIEELKKEIETLKGGNK